MKKIFKTISDNRKIYLGSIGNGIYSRNVTNQHLYKINDEKGEKYGWTIDKDLCKEEVFTKCFIINIKNDEEEVMYTINVDKFMKLAIKLNDRYFVEKKHFSTEKMKNNFVGKIEVVDVS